MITITRATIDMCAELANIKHKVWQTAYKGIYPDSKIDNYDYNYHAGKFEKYIQSSDTATYVAMDESTIIGYMIVGKSNRAYDSSKLEILSLNILQNYRGQKVGTKLFQLAKQYIHLRGHKDFIISCNKYNFAAQKFYTAMGGVIIHTDPDAVDKSQPQVKYLYKIEDDYQPTIIETLDLYNINNDKTGEIVVRGDKRLNDNEYIKLVTIWIKSQGKYLMQICSKEKGSEYAVSGGHVTSGKTSIEQAVIEVKEELGWIIDKTRLINLGSLPIRHALFDVYLYEDDNLITKPVTLQEEEVADIMWCDIPDILQLKETGLLRKSTERQLFEFIIKE